MPGSAAAINGALNLSIEGAAPYANSFHSGGVNFCFCDGSVRFISSSINGEVYAKLITPQGARLPAELRQLPVDQDAYVK
jgi:prepilin-type processing-associated H-X9-DG protein